MGIMIGFMALPLWLIAAFIGLKLSDRIHQADKQQITDPVQRRQGSRYFLSGFLGANFSAAIAATLPWVIQPIPTGHGSDIPWLILLESTLLLFLLPLISGRLAMFIAQNFLGSGWRFYCRRSAAGAFLAAGSTPIAWLMLSYLLNQLKVG
jgi:hypothetical protein